MSGEVKPEGCFENPVLTGSGGEKGILWNDTVLKERGSHHGHIKLRRGHNRPQKTEKALIESETRYRSYTTPHLTP